MQRQFREEKYNYLILRACLFQASESTGVKSVIKGSSWMFESMVSNVVKMPHLADQENETRSQE